MVKKGDRVRVINTEGSYARYLGAMGTAQESDDLLNVLLDLDGETHAFYQSQLELVKEEKRMFNKGRRVVLIRTDELDEDDEKYVGSTGVVQENDDVPYVKMDLDGAKIALCQEELMAPEDFFKPGDKVKILGTGNDFLEQYIGTTGEFLGGHCVKVSGGSHAGVWGFNRLQKVEEEKAMEFKVGDKVIADASGKWYENEEMKKFAKDKTIGIIDTKITHSGTDVLVKFPNGNKWHYAYEDLKLAVLPVGTKVKILAEQYSHMSSVGKTGVIERNNDAPGRNYYVKLDGVHWHYNLEELEVITEDKPSFTKADLKEGMLVLTRDGEWRMIMFGVKYGSSIRDAAVRLLSKGYFGLTEVADDLTNTGWAGSDLDIMKVATVASPSALFEVLRERRSIESCDGFKVIFSREKEELQKQVADLKSKIEAKEKALEALA